MLIGYARVSTEDQDLGLQIAALKAAGCERIYEDKKSGKNLDRPGWKRCRRDLRAGDTLVIWKLDRLGRSALDLINLLDEFRREGIDFVCTTQGFDTRTPIGNFTFQMFAAFAELERSMISERTKAGIEQAKERGVLLGGLPAITEKIWPVAVRLIEEYRERDERLTDQALSDRVYDETGERLSWGTFRKHRKLLEEGGDYPEAWAERWRQRRERQKEAANAARKGRK